MGRARRPPGSLLAAVAADELGDPGRADAAPVVVHCQAPVCRLAWLPRARVMTSWSGACTVADRVAAVTIGLPAGLPARASRGSATAATTTLAQIGALARMTSAATTTTAQAARIMPREVRVSRACGGPPCNRVGAKLGSRPEWPRPDGRGPGRI